jgi:speckle-type POZ protein
MAVQAIHHSMDFDSLCLKADCFRIRCDVTVVLETRDESSVLPSPDLHWHLGNMLASGVGGDVAFEVGKQTFVAHKNVPAARSPVFMAEFFGSMKEEKAAATRVRILGILYLHRLVA